jgi:hypothetical protein
MNWLRRLDDALFSPPHTFQTILAFVTVRLSLVFDSGQKQSRNVESQMAEETTEQASIRRPT